MPQFRVLQKSFIGGRIVEEGELVDYDGETSDNLEPVKPRKKGAEPPAEQAAANLV